MKSVDLNLTIDAASLVVAIRRAIRPFLLLSRAFVRIDYTPGDRHIERIMADCVAKRQDVETTARRLMVASDIAGVLDGAR